jgi:hypothetical protein
MEEIAPQMIKALLISVTGYILDSAARIEHYVCLLRLVRA